MSEGRPSVDRRTLLRAALGLSLLPLVSACDAERDALDPEAGPEPDAEPTDGTLSNGQVGPDGGSLLSEDLGGAPGEDLGPDAGAAPDASFVRGPWLQLGGPGEVHFRVEVFAGAPNPQLIVDGAAVSLAATEAEVTWKWPPAPVIADADLAGRYTLHQARISGLRPGQVVNWRCDGGFGTQSGRVRVAGSGGAWRLAWVSDTMWPRAERVAARLAALAPDLVLHGGDVQYRTNPGDTYNGFFRIWGPLLRQAPINFCLGNHEYESADEFGDFFARLFAQQGSPGPGGTPFVIAAGAVRFVMLDSEQLGFDEASPQLPWLVETLAGFQNDPDVLQVVACFHRPYFTFASSGFGRDTRARMHGIFQAAGVRLVLTGHNHCYERFSVDGIAYIVDGGGGALLSDIDEELPAVRAEHPEEEAWRLVASRSHGGLIFDVGADGTLTAVRLDDGEGETDRFVVAPWRS